MIRIIKSFNLKLALGLVLLVNASLAIAANATVELLDVNIVAEQGSKAKVMLKFSGKPAMPKSFSMDEPEKIIFDFFGVVNNLPDKKRSQFLETGVIREINIVDAEDQTRIILDVAQVVPFDVDVVDNNVIITLVSSAIAIPSAAKQEAAVLNKLKSVDFRRGDAGEGRLIIGLAADDMSIDFRDEGEDIVAEFKGGTVAEQLQRRFDVSDFSTPIQRFAVLQEKNRVVIKLRAKGDFEKVAYQIDDEYVIEVRPLSQEERELNKSRTFKFTGERISLNFQDIEIRAVLQLMADFTGLNIVASDSVSGNVTLRLENVPWDQALDFVLKTKGLGKRESGNIILIAPNEEIASREQLELEARLQSESLTALRSEFIQVNYAKSNDIMSMLKEEQNSMLSTRGSVSMDERTNTLLVKDTPERLVEIKSLVEKLDVPVRQVLIEAQVVQTTDNFDEAFGLQLGGAFRTNIGKYNFGFASDKEKSRAIADGKKITSNENGVFFNTTSNSSSAPNGKLGISVAKLPGGTLLDLELAASEYESKAKVLSKPKLMTLDQQPASIESGQEIAYSVVAEAGATPTITFKKATLRLEVTPQITPNDKVLMELKVNQDRPGENINGQASINTTSLETNILVDNAETIVLGGIYTVDQSKVNQKVPFFGDIPVLGKLFKSDTGRDNRSEILIFVTPKIVKSILKEEKV